MRTMRDKICAFLIVILAILNLVFDLISPPVHLYRNLIEADIGFLVFSIVINCYYKQLARKTEEYKEALKQLEFTRTHNTVLLAELQAEQQKVKELEKANFDYNIACTRQEECIKAYKQALEEIKEICLFQNSIEFLPFITIYDDILHKCEVLDE